MTEPRFSEMQAVRPSPTAQQNDWGAGIVISREWEEAGQNPGERQPHGPRWVYEVQVDHSDAGEIYELWLAEDDLQAR